MFFLLFVVVWIAAELFVAIQVANVIGVLATVVDGLGEVTEQLEGRGEIGTFDGGPVAQLDHRVLAKRRLTDRRDHARSEM